MEYLSGERFIDCFDDLSKEKKQTAARDVANIMFALYSITSALCGSILYDHLLSADQHPCRYSTSPNLPVKQIRVGDFTLGPCNEFAFMESLDFVPVSEGGPFDTELAYLRSVAFAGIPHDTSLATKSRRWPYEKVLEVYECIQPCYADKACSELGSSDGSLFHLAHGDLSISNLLLDPSSGHVTGVLDWEVSGFRPAWAAATAGGWFDDDDRRFIMSQFQDGPEGFDDETDEDAKLRESFRAHVGEQSRELLFHLWHGVELRAIWQTLRDNAPSSCTGWLEKYERTEWSQLNRGPFPFDLQTWLGEDYDLWKL